MDDSSPQEPFGADAVPEGAARRLENAKKSYDQILNRLSAGNSAGALAAIAALGADKLSTKELLPALCLFLAGLLSLGIGSFASLVSTVRILRAWESAESALDLRADAIQRPSEEAGLRFDFQMVTGLFAAAMFLIGTSWGLLIAFTAFC
jgi:hypothetical protein